ncbi:hypothetical protein GF420_01070, partial [candidate division GN15 bacterium]|nr:hypothetical protein [candidate division GN15 bacterium]
MPRKLHTTLIPVAAVVVLAIACGTEKTSGPTTLDNTAYPSTIGTEWVYERINQEWNMQDTLTITLERDSIAPDGVRIGIASFEVNGVRRQTRFLRIAGDTIEWYVHALGQSGFYLLERYILPMEPGDKWKMLDAFRAYDTMYVLDRNAVSVPFGTFSRTYHLNRLMTDSATGAIQLDDEQYYAPGYGIVKRRTDDMQSEDLWELIDFN